MPLDKITDGYKFQQIVAEYFRSLKSEKLDFTITDIDVSDYGIGGDDGCDILVEFWYEDAICGHSQKWIVECKSQKGAVKPTDINTNNIVGVLKSKSANGYLLVCRNDATASLKRIFTEMGKNGDFGFKIWNGSELWHRLIRKLSLIQAFFPEYYRENFLENRAEFDYDKLVKQFEKKLKETTK